MPASMNNRYAARRDLDHDRAPGRIRVIHPAIAFVRDAQEDT
jgi:hypothetical protein